MTIVVIIDAVANTLAEVKAEALLNAVGGMVAKVDV